MFNLLTLNYLCIVETIRKHFSQESKEATSIGILCEHANSHGTRNFTGDMDLQAEFRNDWHQVSISESQGKELQIGRDKLKMLVGGVHH